MMRSATFPYLQPQPDDLAHFATSPTDPGVRQRIVIERAIVRQACTDLIAAGFVISVDDGEAFSLRKSTDLNAIMVAIMATDEETLCCTHAGTGQRGRILLVYGNDGWDVIADNTLNLETHLHGASALADRLCDAATQPRRLPIN